MRTLCDYGWSTSARSTTEYPQPLVNPLQVPQTPQAPQATPVNLPEEAAGQVAPAPQPVQDDAADAQNDLNTIQ